MFDMKRWVIVLAGVLLVTGCSSGGAARSASTPAAASSSVAPTAATSPDPASAAASQGVAVPAVIGLKGDEAKDALKKAGFDVQWSETVVISSNWTVDAQTPSPGGLAAIGSKVLLTVSKHDDAPAQTTTAAPAAPAAPADDPDASTAGLDVAYAITACDRYGDARSPYGWNADFIIDGTHIRQDDGLFLKAGVTIKNAAGVKGRFTVECFVNGTDDAPTVQTFTVY